MHKPQYALHLRPSEALSVSDAEDAPLTWSYVTAVCTCNITKGTLLFLRVRLLSLCWTARVIYAFLFCFTNVL